VHPDGVHRSGTGSPGSDATREERAVRPNVPTLVWTGVVALLLCVVHSAVAQLHEHCTVSVLNRNVQVNLDGSWVLPNVPANFGQVRARATCVQNGVTTSGESAFFTLPTNEVVNLPDIVLGATTHIPVSLSVTPGRVSLTAAGQTTQLAVTATYPDRSLQDVTAANTGTSYTTSNLALVTVSPDGLVTAVASGTVVIQATHDGAAGLITATVTLSSVDTDGDGIPDDVELALGLDPNNPIDAQEDFDRDGLTNLQEDQLGTNLRVADVDGDGLADGQEVALGTNPLLADTDGDGIRDGLEVQTGSNPLDATSFNLAQALTSIDVAPSTFVITLNTVLGEASRQLTVTGHLRDGTTIDLTSTAKRTNYAASDLTICNFGATPGQIFAGLDGTCTITVTNSGFSTSAIGTVRTFAPRALSFVTIPGSTNNVDVSGDFAYVAAGSAGLQVISIMNRNAPTLVAAFDTPGNANDVKVIGTTAFVADGPAGLHIIDVTDPLHPRALGTVDTPGDAQDVVVRGSLAFVADGPTGLHLITVSNPTAPSILSAIELPGGAQGVDVAPQNHLAVVAASTFGLHVIDITDPATPTLLGSVAMDDAQDVALDVNGHVAFVADVQSSFTAVALSDPRRPVVQGSPPRATGGLLVDVALAGRFAFGADMFFVNGVPIFDVSTPAAPVPRAILNFSQFGDDNGTGIAADSAFVYLTTDRRRLLIGQYLQLEDTIGIPPTVSLLAPAPGETFTEGQTRTLRVQATDDITVASVSFLVNGEVRFTDTAAPYEFMLIVPVGVTHLTLSAQAIDFGGNVATTQDVIIPVLPNPPPVVALTSPAASATLIQGETITISADASDDTQVVSVLLTVNGLHLPLDTTPPFSAPFTVPLGIDSLTIVATATDNLGKIATATRTVTVMPDPGTTMVGRVVDLNGQPVQGATVTCVGVSGLTEVNGTFSLAGIPTVQGDIQCTVTVVTPNGQTLTSVLGGISPVLGGVTDVGTIMPRPLHILVFGDAATGSQLPNAGVRGLLTADLTALGYTVTTVVTLPTDLSPYRTIWHLGGLIPLTTAEQSRLAAFVEAGGGLHLTGEGPCCATLNNSVGALLHAVVSNGGITVGGQGVIGGPYPFHPSAAGGVTTTPHQLGQWNPADPGGIGGLGSFPDPNMLVTGAGNLPVGGVWDCRDLVKGVGRMTLLIDLNWFTRSGRREVIENIQRFLGSGHECH
jgi:hypothetical protein